MNRRNLIPAKRLQAKRLQRAIRRWVLIDAVYFLVLLIAGMACAASMLRGNTQDSVGEVGTRLQDSTAAVNKLRQQSIRLQTAMQSVMQVSNRPDWSVLLAAISQKLGDDVVLNTIDCTDDGPGPANVAAVSDTPPLHFRISGFGRSQKSVMELVLNLEKLRFFSRVQLVQTGTESLRGCECVGFQLLCDLQDTHGSQD